ncbi:hypothetical protein M9H77_18092 [Catharanthus roseus]|uniref:Uncharacterized protein n=1 Tax=Catharanthus roseus TaxID=4058 RepID=A0ACC0B6G6_CATRO|nr:hypothetical protein M9H77_18092 [Catharanthus roseus]
MGELPCGVRFTVNTHICPDIGNEGWSHKKPYRPALSPLGSADVLYGFHQLAFHNVHFMNHLCKSNSIATTLPLRLRYTFNIVMKLSKEYGIVFAYSELELYPTPPYIEVHLHLLVQIICMLCASNALMVTKTSSLVCSDASEKREQEGYSGILCSPMKVNTKNLQIGKCILQKESKGRKEGQRLPITSFDYRFPYSTSVRERQSSLRLLLCIFCSSYKTTSIIHPLIDQLVFFLVTIGELVNDVDKIRKAAVNTLLRKANNTGTGWAKKASPRLAAFLLDHFPKTLSPQKVISLTSSLCVGKMDLSHLIPSSVREVLFIRLGLHCGGKHVLYESELVNEIVRVVCNDLYIIERIKEARLSVYPSIILSTIQEYSRTTFQDVVQAMYSLTHAKGKLCAPLALPRPIFYYIGPPQCRLGSEYQYGLRSIKKSWAVDIGDNISL